MWVFPASLAAACLSGSWWSTDRWRWIQRAGSVYSEGYKQDSCTSPWFIQMLEDVVQNHVDCIIHRPFCSVIKLNGVQQGSSNVLQVGQHEPLEWLHHHRCLSNRFVVIKSCDFGFLGYRDDGGAFEAGEDFTQLQWSVEDLCEDGW